MIAERFTRIIRRFQQAFGDGLRPALRTSPLNTIIHNRMTRLYQRFASLYAKWRAGKLPTPRIRPAKPRPERTQTPPELRLPRDFAWLLKMSQPASAGLNYELRMLLIEPETKEFLAACPQAGRYLRPIAHAVAMKPDESELAPIRLPPKPKRKRLPRVAPPKPRVQKTLPAPSPPAASTASPPSPAPKWTS
jgi:hypothetical protein